MHVSVHLLQKYIGPWTEKQLHHLLARALYGVTLEDLAQMKGKTMQQCADLLLAPLAPAPPPCTPYFRKEADPTVPDGTTFVFYPENKERDEDWNTYIQIWWSGLLVNQTTNIREKMTLFWHNHFAIEFNVVKDSRYAYHYVNTLHQHAIGNFKHLLRAMTTAPSMLVYLNGNLNKKEMPNENFGRELQELFTIGKGHGSQYTEKDVKAAAKVLTGWKDDKDNIGSFFDPDSHNTEDKVFSAFYDNHIIKGRGGDEGAIETDELIDMICAHPEVAKYLCRKLYRWLVHSVIDDAVEENVIVPLANILRQSDYEMKPLLEAILTSRFFYEPQLIGSILKSPADYFIGIARQLHLKIYNPFEGPFLLLAAMSESGMQLGNPPNVAGWPAYWESPTFDKKWIRSECFSARHRWLKDFFYSTTFNLKSDHFLEFDFVDFIHRLPHPQNATALVTDIINLLCPLPPGAKQIARLQTLLNEDEKKIEWAQLWLQYENNAPNNEWKEIMHERLRKFFSVLLSIPEYQIM